MDLDARAGDFFTYRDFVACGETYHHLSKERGAPFDNTPRATATFAAIEGLCREVLDPLVRRFGEIQLTYGFASPALTRHIQGRIHPPGDQHAGHELGRAGKPICSRLGFAVDFAVPGTSSVDVARWIADCTAFDRLYVYEPERPLHVSVGPETCRQIVMMRRGPSGRRMPRVVKREEL